MSKVVFNITYTAANPPKYMVGNKRAEYMAQRNFYNLTADYNYFSYILNHKKIKKNSTAGEYFTQNGDNDGLFDFNGKMSKDKIVELTEDLKNTQSNIWHGFISFDQETTLGLDTQEKAIHFMQQTFKPFLKDAGLKLDNIGVYFALHIDKSHHSHIHFAFYEKEAKRRDKEGILCYTKKGKISSAAIDNYMVSANMHLSENREVYYTSRDKAMAMLREITKQPIRKQEVNFALDELRKKLPAKGRLQYNAKNMEQLRPEIDRVAELLIASDSSALKLHKEMHVQLDKAKQEVMHLIRDNKLAYVNGKRLTKDDIKQITSLTNDNKLPMSYVDVKNIKYFDNLQKDYQARIGNIVLGLCKKLNYKDAFNRYERDLSKKIAAKNKQRRKESFIQQAITILSAVEKQGNANFIKSVQETIREQEMEKMYQGYDAMN